MGSKLSVGRNMTNGEAIANFARLSTSASACPRRRPRWVNFDRSIPDVLYSRIRWPKTNQWSPIRIITRNKREIQREADRQLQLRKERQWAPVQPPVIIRTNDYAATVTTALATEICPVTNPDNSFASCLLLEPAVVKSVHTKFCRCIFLSFSFFLFLFALLANSLSAFTQQLLPLPLRVSWEWSGPKFFPEVSVFFFFFLHFIDFLYQKREKGTCNGFIDNVRDQVRAEAGLKDWVFFCGETFESWRTFATKMKENAIRNMAQKILRVAQKRFFETWPLYALQSNLVTAGPHEAILLVLSRRALTFLLESSLKKWNMTPLLCACAVMITLETQKCRKRHLASSNLTFLFLAIDTHSFRRMKEEGQIYKPLPVIFYFWLGT